MLNHGVEPCELRLGRNPDVVQPAFDPDGEGRLQWVIACANTSTAIIDIPTIDLGLLITKPRILPPTKRAYEHKYGLERDS